MTDTLGDTLPREPRYGEWQPIETAPKDGRTIIGWNASWYEPETIRWNRETQAWCSFPNRNDGPDIDRRSWPTHWTSLPAPPAPLPATAG